MKGRSSVCGVGHMPRVGWNATGLRNQFLAECSVFDKPTSYHIRRNTAIYIFRFFIWRGRSLRQNLMRGSRKGPFIDIDVITPASPIKIIVQWCERIWLPVDLVDSAIVSAISVVISCEMSTKWSRSVQRPWTTWQLVMDWSQSMEFQWIASLPEESPQKHVWLPKLLRDTDLQSGFRILYFSSELNRISF